MTSTTSREEAVQVLQILTAEHGNEGYFVGAEITFADGFHGVDMTVDGEKWRSRERKGPIIPRIDRVPICILVHG